MSAARQRDFIAGSGLRLCATIRGGERPPPKDVVKNLGIVFVAQGWIPPGRPCSPVTGFMERFTTLTANDGSGRKTAIKISSVVDGQLMLQGAKNGRRGTW
jgi:hypothetical protein